MKTSVMKIIAILILLVACKKKPPEEYIYSAPEIPDELFEEGIEDDFEDLPEAEDTAAPEE